MVRALAEDEPETLDSDHPVYLLRQHFREGFHPRLPVKGVQYGLRSGRWKAVWAPDEDTQELFDLEADPREQVNLADEHPLPLAALRERIDRWIERFDAGGDVAPRDEGDVERLKALGYVD